MEGGDCSKGKVWVRQTGLACCFLFLQLALVVATFFYFYNIFILHSMQRHHRDGNINLLTKVTSLPHTAIQGIWRWKRLGVYFCCKNIMVYLVFIYGPKCFLTNDNVCIEQEPLCVCEEIQKVTVWKKKRHQRQVKIGTIVGEMNPFHCHALQPSFLFLAISMFYDYFAFCCAFLLNHLTK